MKLCERYTNIFETFNLPNNLDPRSILKSNETLTFLNNIIQYHADFSRNLRKIVKMYYEVNKRKCTLIAYKYGGLMTLHNADFSRNLQKIVNMYYDVNKRKCTLIAYKYGGLMTLNSIASNKKYYETYVENIILISVPFGGQYSSIYEMETACVTGNSTTFSIPGSVSVSSQVVSYNSINGDGLTDMKKSMIKNKVYFCEFINFHKNEVVYDFTP
ncbi:hypothetical protein A3Q56_07736 [Intoshia linei]|uniref:Uncharacterized protein n=1 Tax=Intoshia linei TaxID=1819745 RepID=A0A177AR83_9BILA|nr:hypothetical protein A3Q56_07736 [Intoshia linei]